MRVGNLPDSYGIIRELEEISETFVEAPGKVDGVAREGGCL
jgi:hypothetical protein